MLLGMIGEQTAALPAELRAVREYDEFRLAHPVPAEPQRGPAHAVVAEETEVVTVMRGQLALHRSVDVITSQLFLGFPHQVEGHPAPVNAPHHDTVQKDLAE
ncbi:hypothetical protein [Streptomyces bauhiniae]|uniref:hypothetical protein n=1 Tax=Streptomyces bauhiniae TaxID=2340725 RepID=UPI00142EBF5A